VTGTRIVHDAALGAEFALDERFADVGFPRDDELPTAHYLASVPREGRIAALSIVTVRAEPLPAEEWLAQQVSRARAAFEQWSPEAHEMEVAPAPAALGGRPAIHVRYRLRAREGEERAVVGHGDDERTEVSGPVPASLAEHWTVLVAERRWLLAMELLVQPPAWWDEEREQLELPFRSLELLSDGS